MPSLPWFQFYANDWLADPGLRCCSLAARGLWMDLLAYCHLSPVYGKLLSPSGVKYGPEHIARLVGAEQAEVNRLLAELDEGGVCSRETDGTIFCRRMVRDATKRGKCSAAGKKGGGNRGPRAEGGKFARRAPREPDIQEGSEEPPDTTAPPAATTAEGPTAELDEAALDRIEATLPGASSITKPEPWSVFEAAWKASGLPGHDTLARTSNRVGWWQQRQADAGWRANWRAAIAKAAISPRCMGLAGSWRLWPDMLLKLPDMVQRILEGEFDTEASNGSGRRGSVRSPARIQCDPSRYDGADVVIAGSHPAAAEGTAANVPARKAS
jgi:hypothetical protein